MPIKVHPVKAMVFPVVMCGCESWTIRKAEHRRIDAFELWCWRRLLRVPWTARRANQSILKEISLGCSLEELILKLKLQYFGHLMRRTDSSEKTLMLERLKAGGEGDDRRWDGWMASPTQRTWVWVSSGSWWWTGKPGVLQSMGSQRVGHDWTTELKHFLKVYSVTYSTGLLCQACIRLGACHKDAKIPALSWESRNTQMMGGISRGCRGPIGSSYSLRERLAPAFLEVSP